MIDLLREGDAKVSSTEIRQALAGNLCRCNAYGRIIQSVKAAAKLQRMAT